MPFAGCFTPKDALPKSQVCGSLQEFVCGHAHTGGLSALGLELFLGHGKAWQASNCATSLLLRSPGTYKASVTCSSSSPGRLLGGYTVPVLGDHPTARCVHALVNQLRALGTAAMAAMAPSRMAKVSRSGCPLHMTKALHRTLPCCSLGSVVDSERQLLLVQFLSGMGWCRPLHCGGASSRP